MHRIADIPTVLFVVCLATVGCDVADRRAAEPAPGQGRATLASRYGSEWPLTVEDGKLDCVGPGTNAVFTAADGVRYALNGRANGSGLFRRIEPIRKHQSDWPVSTTVDRLSEDQRRAIFAQAVACEDGNSETACKARLRNAERLAEGELATIGNEGVSKSWPPLEPAYMSLQPLIEDALKLCP
jgi:hypothetical protein